MGVCLPSKKSKFIININEKQSLGKSELSRYSTNFTALKSIKSMKNLSNSNNRISKMTKYDDINKYYILSSEIIGEGNSSIIYGGKSINSQKKGYEYAIKQVIKKIDKYDISLIKEIEINSIINHNNIVHCFDIFEDDLNIYFVFELMTDGDLYDYISKKPNHHLKDKEIIAILKQIFLALIYLHDKLQIVHRDIKPENFMIKKEKNEGIIVKLRDFGTSDFIKNEGFNFINVGTPLYMAPEIYLKQEYDCKVDMWAIGIILYIMATGKHPFDNNNKMKDNLENNKNMNNSDLSYNDEDKIIMNNVLNKELDFNIFENYGLRLLAQRLLERNPTERYSAMEAFNELNKLKNIFLNKQLSQKISDSKKKISVSPILSEDSNKRKKYLAKSNINHKFKGNFKDIREHLNESSEENSEKNDDNSFEKKKNDKKKNNEIRIMIKKKNK